MTENRYMVWIDLEMTGLDPEVERIIEIATILTDGELNIVAEGPVFCCLLYTSPSPRDRTRSRMPSSA